MTVLEDPVLVDPVQDDPAFYGAVPGNGFVADPIGATTSELSDELIFLIASASTDEQRKYATELFRHFARQVAMEAYRLGQRSMAVPRLPAPDASPIEQDTAPEQAPAIQPSQQPSDDPSVSLIPPVSWQD